MIVGVTIDYLFHVSSNFNLPNGFQHGSAAAVEKINGALRQGESMGNHAKRLWPKKVLPSALVESDRMLFFF